MNRQTQPKSSLQTTSPVAGGLLQRTCACGNHTVAGDECESCKKKRLGLQTKLELSKPGDSYEQEADRVAAQVLGTPTQASPPRIQHFSEPPAQQIDVPQSVDQALASPGKPLGSAVQQDMGQRFGHDFSRVRVHTNSAAEQSARNLNAHAYTVGHDLVFSTNRFKPETQEGRHLLAHELTHVVQQSGATQSTLLTHGATLIQRDEAGGGSTEFEDQVTVLSRPRSGPGVITGQVTRTETAPASGSQLPQQIHSGTMNVRFDPSDCSVTIPFGYNFVQAAQATGTGICDEPPPATAVAPLPVARFNAIKADVLATVNRGLNGWFDVQLSGNSCPTGCANKKLPIRVVAREDTAHPDTTITVINRGGRADAATICANSWDSSTAVHEGGHQALGVGDEYPESDERLRATVPQWFRSERVRHDYSAMGPAAHSRFAMFHERHFHAVKTFLETSFPGCTATLQAQARPVIPDFRLVLGGGQASLSGTSGLFLQAGLRVGIPLDRLRRWEFVLGPQVTWLLAYENQRHLDAFLLGARFGLEGSTGGSGHGFTAGAFGEVGYGRFSSRDYALGGTGERRAEAGYGEIGASAGYHTPIIGGSTRFDFRLEGAAGSALGAPGIIGPTTRDIETDPERSRWFRLGVSAGVQF
jgi:Domain of unknown function (DUF4157)